MAKSMIQECPVEKTIMHGYLLQLGNGQGWQVSSTAGARQDVGELGRIMGLKSYDPNGYPKLVFIRRGSANTESKERGGRPHKKVKQDLRGLGWKAHDLWLLRLWSHNDVPDFICEIKGFSPLYRSMQNNFPFVRHSILTGR